MRDPASLFGDLSLTLFGLVAEQTSRIKMSAPLSIMVGSAQCGEGRTFIAEGLALHAASLSQLRILLVDAAWNRPELTARYGGTGEPGLADALLTNELPRLLPTAMPNLHVVGAGRKPESLLLYQRGWSRLFLGWASNHADVVLFDSLSFAVGAEPIADAADRLLMVVDATRTPRALVRSTLARLPRPKVWGIALNNCPERS